ncbi:hypothetical protein NQX30_02090 [Candidatus Persebacteraceae bacterium Df01]|uniref:phosphoribosylamine--glycine ligase n=1 Tax=Candidatus Doriopsillibacter californiensis TaxID=2970740 RepID=A0ABT7QKE7_9GAMM|nr:hypothetical protein [Candidatus Persebacteraceae bacterium Df01]
MDKFLIVGGGGREAAFARQLAKDSMVYAVMAHNNPTIVDCAQQTGGAVCLGNINDGELVADFAAAQAIDYVFVNADNPLQAGVVDTLLAAGISTAGPTREGARIEWDKIYAMEIMARLFPEVTPFFKIITTASDIAGAQKSFAEAGKEIVVKPQGLTGGKGVKVMGEHLSDEAAAADYTAQLLATGNKVLWVEKLRGVEFTIMGLTDGNTVIAAPATYDYPYRYAGNIGAGTGGMGCFSAADGCLPFLSPTNAKACETMMRSVVADMRAYDLHFNGVINGGFFLTADGIKFMEFNARFGDPECINVLSLLESSFTDIIRAFADGTLATTRINFAPQASVVKYLVSPSYPEKGDPVTFTLPVAQLEAHGLSVLFSAAVKTGETAYQTVSSSRVAAVSAMAADIATAAAKINDNLETYFDGTLDYRIDIGTAEDLAALTRQVTNLQL